MQGKIIISLGALILSGCGLSETVKVVEKWSEPASITEVKLGKEHKNIASRYETCELHVLMKNGVTYTYRGASSTRGSAYDAYNACVSAKRGGGIVITGRSRVKTNFFNGQETEIETWVDGTIGQTVIKLI